MRNPGLLLAWIMAWPAMAEDRVSEQDFRKTLALAASTQILYRNGDCKAIDFGAFSAGMEQGWGSQMEHAPDGASVTITLHRRGYRSCPSPYPPLTQMPLFELVDLSGKPVTSASLAGKPTLLSFYFAQCIPCILEVGPLNSYAASRNDMNFLAVTFDGREDARAFVKRFGLKWRVVPDARDFIDRMRVKKYPQLALFDADGKLLGIKLGGAMDELEAATVLPQLQRWVDGLLPSPPAGQPAVR